MKPIQLTHHHLLSSMKSLFLATLCAALAAPAANAQLPPAMAKLPPLTETPAQRDARMQWWRDAKFGLFIHWGPVSLQGVEIGWGRKAPRTYDINGHTGRGADPEYDNLYKRFNPVKFNAAEWVKIAQDAGMKYLVLVCKHHDGFSMFHTKHSDYSIANTPFKRDLVKELADACRAAGLRFGVYYSQRDWYHPDYLVGDNRKYNEFYQEQVRELLTNYGNVDILWFDHVAGFWSDYTYDQLYPMIYQLQPDILINDRGAKFCGRGRDRKQSTLSKLPESREARKIVNGDFYTPEQRIGGMDLKRDWESCITICHQWAWKPNDKMKSFSECIRTLVTCATGGGNLLFNVGPMPTGEIEPRQVERLKEMGAWLGKYGDSIYGTQGGPYRNGRWGGSTRKGKTVWLHVFEWNGDTLRLPALPAKVVGIKSLTGGKPSFQQTASGLDVTVAKSDQDPVNTVIELTLDQALPAKLALGSTRSLANDPNYGEVLLTQSAIKMEKSKPLVLDLGGNPSVAGISMVLAKGKIAAKTLSVAISHDGTNWENVRSFDRLTSLLEVSLSRTVAGADVLGRPVRSIRIEADAPLQLDQVKVLGKPR
jgi:alpha-L-fucosidase